MAACPRCAGPLEHAGSVFFCPSCRASLQEARTLATSLGRNKDDAPLEVATDRFAHPIGGCPACEKGELREGRLLDEVIATCDGCGAWWIAAAQLVRIRARALRDRAPRRAPALEPDHIRDAHAQRIAFDDPITNRYAYPAALLLGLVTHVLGLSFIVWGTVEMWFHELGHAVVAWLSGFVAVPLPFFTMMVLERRSGWVIAIVLGMSLAIAYEARKHRRTGLVMFAGVVVAFQLLLTVIVSAGRAREWALFAGQAGAIVLPTLVMWAFYQPIGWRWDFWRYPMLGVAAIGLVHALFIWFGVATGTGVMPHGSAIGDDSEGDMERLVSEYAWTLKRLASTYLAIAIACLIVLAITYVFFIRRAHAKKGGSPSFKPARSL